MKINELINYQFKYPEKISNKLFTLWFLKLKMSVENMDNFNVKFLVTDLAIKYLAIKKCTLFHVQIFIVFHKVTFIVKIRCICYKKHF